MPAVSSNVPPASANRSKIRRASSAPVPLTQAVPNLFGIVRFEAFQPRRGPAGVGGLVGVFWRPWPWLVVRTDYLFANRSLERLTPGLHGSVSLLF